MKITLVKINKNKWFPFIIKDVLLRVTKDDGEEINIQPMSIGWTMKIKTLSDFWDIEDLDEAFYNDPVKREWELTKKHLIKIWKEWVECK